MKHEKLTWKDVEKLVDILEQKFMKEKKKYDFIIGINRGGLIPSVMLSHRLGSTHGVHTVHSYNGTEKRQLKADLYLSMVGFIHSHNTVLLVDDIADSGESIQASLTRIKKLDSDIKNIDVATLHYKPKSIYIPQYYAKKIDNDIWIDYPWEQHKYLGTA